MHTGRVDGGKRVPFIDRTSLVTYDQDSPPVFPLKIAFDKQMSEISYVDVSSVPQPEGDAQPAYAEPPAQADEPAPAATSPDGVAHVPDETAAVEPEAPTAPQEPAAAEPQQPVEERTLQSWERLDPKAKKFVFH